MQMTISAEDADDKCAGVAATFLADVGALGFRGGVGVDADIAVQVVELSSVD